ncbi:MAG: hypothetical protein ABEJ31_13070 [Haloarculaceae archaeon]
MDDSRDRASILSHGEREVAAMLREGRSIEEIADARDDTPAAVEKAVDRIRAKTDRALATLAQSPFAAEVLADLDAAERDALADLFEE